ncbi:immunoglobulin-binding protein 1 [Uranotaenia lowii]|uniref:immunoglobulin-binding protein 1 n=1 Tax=Uranotaenia lowii TaxID=190385 RepID=UPI00247B2365|nr:immunoglobulin-binding protein 1 [Uranotaenia lowii]
MAQPNEIPNDRKLSEIFEEAYKLMVSFETCYEPTNSPEFQANIKKCIGLYEDSTRLVSLCGLFSANESYEEVATENLRYLLLPFFLAQLTQKLCKADRKEVVEVAEVYYKDFLSRCEEYKLCDKPESSLVPANNSSNSGDQMQQLARMTQERNAKLRKYQEKKELDDQIKQLKIAMEKEHVEDDIKRDFYMKLLKSCILEARDELVSIGQEKQILEHIAVMRRNDGESDGQTSKLAKGPAPRPLKPIIITRDVLQKAIYGAGYPSLPTMTVDEFYDQRVREGIFPDEERMKQINKNSLMNRVYQDHEAEQDKEDEENEKLTEQDDEEYLARQRAKDEYRDDHRRGEGNRYNRS